jgi:hypothetical protein
LRDTEELANQEEEELSAKISFISIYFKTPSLYFLFFVFCFFDSISPVQKAWRNRTENNYTHAVAIE